MKDQDQLACMRTIIRSLNALDRGRYERLAEQFAPDGVWHRQGERLEGRGAILEALNRRPAGVLTRHLLLNTEIEFTSETEAVAESAVLVFRHDSDKPVKAAPMELPKSVLDYSERLVKQDGAWRIAERKSARVFARG